MPIFYFNTSKFFARSLILSLIVSLGFVSTFMIGTQSVFAEPSASGISGIVTDTNDDPVDEATIQFSCIDEDYWPDIAQTNSSGEYERLGIYDGNLGCEGPGDGEVLKVRAVKDGYMNSAEVSLVTIDYAAAGAVNLVEWTDWYFATLRTQDFVIEKLPPGWSGTVLDYDDEPIEGATFTLTCEGETRTLDSTTDASGVYSISQLQFTSAISNAACYYSDYFSVTVTVSKNGYLSDAYTIEEVTGSDMGASSFNFAETHNFWLEPDPALAYAEGDGSENNPFIVDTVERFEGMGDFPEYAEGIYFALDEDITFGDDQEYVGNFAGILDGRNHIIAGSERPLFNRLQGGAEVKNLLIDASIYYNYQERNIGILTSFLEDGSYIENVHTSGSINVECAFSVCDRIGGLVGEMSGTSRIYRSSSSADLLSSGDNVFASGGLVGFINGGSIEQSYATGDVYAISGAGGLAGSVNGTPETTRVIDSYATGNVYTRGQYFSTAAGFVGELGGGLVMRSYSTGSVFASTTPAGGFVGEVNSEDAVIANSFSIASEVEGNGEVGGFMGSIYAGEVRNSAWLREIGKDAVGFVDGGSACGLNGPLDLLMSTAPCNFGYDIGTFDEFKHNGYGGELAPVYLDGEDSWDFGGVWGFHEEINGGLPYLLWGTEWENEEEPEEEVDEEEEGNNSSSSGRSGGSRRSSTQNSTQSIAQQTAPAIQTSPTLFTRNLDVGMTGSDVKDLQRFLNSRGFTVAQVGPGSLGNETDMFGNATKAALARFQSANGIVPAAGHFGPVTRAYIANMGATTSILAPSGVSMETPAVPQAVRDLDMGMSGDDVRALQTLLMAQGYSIPAGATGFFATQTRDALAAYQAKNAITPSVGYFGVKTRVQMTSAELVGLWWVINEL